MHLLVPLTIEFGTHYSSLDAFLTYFGYTQQFHKTINILFKNFYIGELLKNKTKVSEFQSKETHKKTKHRIDFFGEN